MSETGPHRILPDQSLGSGHSFGTPRHPSINDPILSKRVCFYKSGDPQFSGLRMVINNRTFKTFDALLDSLSKKVPLPFGVRNITTPRGVHAIYTLDELEDGKSYICSDSRKVKPVNLALARKKLPPWYHARPVSSRRRTVQQAKLFPGQSIHKKERVAVRTPKRLLVFRNGVPTVKYTVVIHKRTTPTFESVLEYISELIQFPVVKLHTPDGRRVDGLPGLILCSGVVVAVGREPFRPANYNAQKSPTSTVLPTNRTGVRRLKALNRKKKSPPYTQSRKFSPSSERYIVNRIHDSIARGSCDLPSNPTNSVELESGRILESVAETEGDSCLGDGAGGQECLLPTEDDIEKSFRVNQDGSMTVEMRVRLTVKEEETVHWTTTLSRSSLTNQINGSCLPESEAQREISSLKSNSLDLESPTASVEIIRKDKTEDNNDEDPPSLGNGAFSECSKEEDDIEEQMNTMSQRRAPTPGHKQVRKKLTSVESIQSETAEGIQEDTIGSYSYREETERGALTERYCMVKQSSTKPVPKPRRPESVNGTDVNSRNVSTFKSAGLTEILQIDSSGEDVTETVLHIYEQQTCQDNFLANLWAPGSSASGIPVRRPATSGTGQPSPSNEFEAQFWRPSTASETINIWREESTAVTADLTLPSHNSGAIQATNAHQRLPDPNEGKETYQQREADKDMRVPAKPKVINKRGRRQKENSAQATEKRKKIKTFSSAGSIKKIYGTKSKSAKSMKKRKKGPTQTGNEGVTTKTSQTTDERIKHVIEDSDVPAALRENPSQEVSFYKSMNNSAPSKARQRRGIQTQTSGHKSKNKSHDVNASAALPALNSTSVTNEYVESWLEKSPLNPTAKEESRKIEAVTQVQREHGSGGESEKKRTLMIVAKEEKCLEETSETQTRENVTADLLPESPQGASVKERIQSFENKTSSQSMEKISLNQQIVHSHTTPTKTGHSNGLAENHVEELQPLSNHCCADMIPRKETSAKKQADSGNKSSPIKISLKDTTPSSSLSMELPPPPPPVDHVEFSEHGVMDVVSSELYRLSSESSQTSDNHPSSISPTSDKAASPTEHAVEMATSIQTDVPSTQEETPSRRTPSIKRAPLVSNVSLDRKMSLRKARVDKYTLCGDATPETTTSPTPVNGVGDNVLSGTVCSTTTQEPPPTPPEEISRMDLKNNPLCCSSSYPTSLTSEERTSSASISSSEAPTPNDLPFKETKTSKTPLLAKKEASSPKPTVKKVKHTSSPSPERRSQTKKSSSELPHNSPKVSSVQKHSTDKTMSPNIGVRKHVGHSSESKPMFNKLKQQKTLSPYSQSLDMMSPPVRHKAGKRLSRNLSSDNAAESKISSERKRHQTPQSTQSTAEVDKTVTCNTQSDQSDDNNVDKTDDLISERSMSESQVMPKSLNVPNQPNMKPVLEEICSSIKSIRQTTQNKCPSCLERSNSLPDFSSQVASTFGSSSEALLAFLSVTTLKECMTNLNVEELNAKDVSCAEALKMIESLRDIAVMEDSHSLKVSLSKLQQSASEQLLQSWKGFQELGDKWKREELVSMAGPEKDCGIGENVTDKIMDNLDIPEKLKEELAALSADVQSDEEKISAGIIERVEWSHVAHEEKATLRDIRQSRRSSSGRMTETVKHKTTGEATEEEDGKYGKNGGTKCPSAEPNDEYIHEESQLYSEVVFLEENGEGEQSGGGTNQEHGQQGHKESKSNREKGSMKVVVSCTPKVGEKDMEGNQQQMHSVESGSEQQGWNVTCVNKGLEQKMSCEQKVASGEGSERRSSEEEPEVEGERIQQERRESDYLSMPENHSEEEEDKQPSSCHYVELNVRGKGGSSSSESQNRRLLEEEQPEVNHPELSQDALSHPASPSDSENERQSGASVGNSAVDEPSSAEERVECEELKVIIDEGLTGNEQRSKEERESLRDPPEEAKQCYVFDALTEETEEVSSEDDDETQSQNTVEGDLSNLVENQDTKKDNIILTKSDILAKHCRFSADSGNDHSSCEEQDDVEQPKHEGERISSSVEEELSYYDKEYGSDEEHAHEDSDVEGSCAEYKEAPSSEGDKCERTVEKDKQPCEEIISQSIAERVILLEKQVAEAQNRKNTTAPSPMTRLSQRRLDSGGEDSELPTSESPLGTRSAPQSSLCFSYDSSGVIITEPDGNRVRSIRDMFLAKSATDIQHGRFPSPNTIEPCQLRAETSVSGGYQSQTSSDLSSGEDDSAGKSITKGFVRKTIERLYGRKDANPDEDASKRSPSVSKQKTKEHSNIFSPFHAARSKAMSELSYLSSTNALDTLSEATRCVAFNAQVGPGDSVPIDNGRWLHRENAPIRKSVSDPAGMNKTFTSSPHGEGTCEDTAENPPRSPLSTRSEQEDKSKSFSKSCTYFSLPHANDSDVCQEDLNTVAKSSTNGDAVAETKGDAEDTKAKAERNGKLPGVSIPEFKMMDNKVHPLTEPPPDGEVVVAQPVRGQGALHRRLQEPDVLDLLYDFCGQNCPIL